jgi:hypothetical protein
MSYFEHPLFLVFAFTVLAFLAGQVVVSPWKTRESRSQTVDGTLAGGRAICGGNPARHPVSNDFVGSDGPGSPDSVDLDKKEAPGQILRREETRSRLALLSSLIANQNSRIAAARTKGLDVALLEEQLKILSDSREEYYSALKRLLLDSTDGENVYRGDQWPV